MILYESILNKVKDNLIETPYDISDIVNAVFDLAGTLSISDISNSPYIHRKVENFVMLSNSHTEDMLKKINETFQDLKTFKRKRDFLTRDPEVDDYLTTFMSVIISGYKTSQAINKGIYKLNTVSGETKFMQNGQSLQNLIYLRGISLRQRANSHVIHDDVKEKIENSAKKTVDTFHHKEVEEMVEYAVVSFLFKYRDYVR